jgi:hypothetical protein
MADWPDTAELGRVLDVDTSSDDWTVTLDRVMAAAIGWVKGKVGDWDELVDEPDDNLAQAALRMAELMALRPETAAAVGSNDPTMNRLLFGRRRKFGIS